MKKYRVLLEGKNFWLSLDKDTPKQYGFVTTRFVEAETPEQAEQLAVDFIKADDSLKQSVLNEESKPPLIYAKEIVELDTFEDRDIPGSGYSFYIQDEE